MSGSRIQPPAVAVILAAGRGSRLLPHTEELPKCLLAAGTADAAAESILDFQLRQLLATGVENIIVVTGFAAARVAAACRPHPQVRCVENRDYATTNSLHSLALAAPLVAGRAFLLLNGDVLFHPEILARLLASVEPCALTLDAAGGAGEEEMKVRVADGRVAEISKALPRSRSHGESLGLLRFDVRGGEILFEEAARLVAEGEGGSWAPRAYNEVIKRRPIAVVEIGGLPWIEIDTPADLAAARARVYPACQAQVASMERP